MQTRRRTTGSLPPFPRTATAVPHIHALPAQGPLLSFVFPGPATGSGARSPSPRGRVAELSRPRRFTDFCRGSGSPNRPWHSTLRDGRSDGPPSWLSPASGRRRRARSSSSGGPQHLPFSGAPAAERGAAPSPKTPPPPLNDIVAAPAAAPTAAPAAATADSSAVLPRLVPFRPVLRPALRSRRVMAARRREMAAAVLHRLFVPLWRLHRQRRRTRAVGVVQKHFIAAVERRRTARRRVAADLLVGLLSRRAALSVRVVLGRYTARVRRVQRAVRDHQRRVAAAVELNLRRMRREYEAAYWAAVVQARGAELLRAAAEAASEEEGSPAPVEDPATPSGRWRARRRPSLELDVYNYYLAGPMPEALLRAELWTAIVTALRRSAREALFFESGNRDSGAPTPSPTTARCPPLRLHQRAVVAVFLPLPVCQAVMDNVCFVASQFRDDRNLRAHLRGRERTIATY